MFPKFALTARFAGIGGALSTDRDPPRLYVGQPFGGRVDILLGIGQRLRMTGLAGRPGRLAFVIAGAEHGWGQGLARLQAASPFDEEPA